MPLYFVTHTVSLTPSQQDDLAQSITRIHTELFNAPSLFVNVRFSTASQDVGYVGGRKRETNTVVAHVRHGPSRTAEHYDRLMVQIAEAWGRVVPDDKDVRIFVMGDIVAGYEHGFAIPPAGGDKEWMKKNLPEFEKKADEGNEEMRGLVEEIRARKMLD